MRGSDMKCITCGRFISDKSFEDKKVIHGRDQAWDGEPIREWYAHKECGQKPTEHYQIEKRI